MRRWLLGILATSLALPAVAYQFRTHHGVTRAAREYLLDPTNGFDFDANFKRFLKLEGPGAYNLIDSRAGDPYEDAWVDEDHEEGRLERMVVFGCR